MSTQYQPYWKAYCKVKNLPLDHEPVTMLDYIEWINRKWKLFEPDEFERLWHVGHSDEFVQWLKTQTD